MLSTILESHKKINLNDITFNPSLIKNPGDIIKHIICNNCNNLLINVAFCQRCGRSYCGKCSSVLGVCKCEEKTPLQPMINFITQGFNISCPSESNCTLCQVRDLEEHINKCQHIILNTCEWCGKEDIKPQIDRHVEECPEKTFKCKFCKKACKRDELDNHENICDKKLIPCPNCNEQILLVTLLEHSTSSQCIFTCFKKLKNELELVKEELRGLKSQEMLGRKRPLRLRNSLSENMEDTSLQISPREIIRDKATNEIACLLRIVANNRILIASGGFDGFLRIWNVPGQNPLIEESAHRKINSIIQLRSNNQDIILLTCGNDGKIAQWNIGQGTQLKDKLYIHDSSRAIFAIAQLSDNYIAWAGKSNMVYTKNFDTDSAKMVYKGHTNTIYSIALIKNQEGLELIASGSGDRLIKLWKKDNEKALKDLSGHKNTVCHLSVINEPTPTLISSSFDKTTRLWNINDGTCVMLKEHSQTVYSSIYVSFSHMILTCSADKTVKILDHQTKKCLKTLKTDIQLKCLTGFENDGKVFILAGGLGKFYIWKLSFDDRVNNINHNNYNNINN
jgi:WD40 repeat protein